MNKLTIPGTLKLIIGPMYAGKSTELIRLTNRLNFLNKKVIAINHSFNTRYGTNQISTHNKNILENCITLSTLSYLFNMKEYQEAEYIIIEETQFFSDAFESIKKIVEEDGKNVICAGLTSDYNRKEFGDMSKLILIADEVQMLKALCAKCKDGTLACFTKKNIDDRKKIDVGSFGVYEAVCRYHYIN